ncbi:hypothetical protein BDL97_01G105100 [Sphagnum fallax]|uniref:Uncharacterized protein n=1 Tax=Sphagnum jensenii TaxID=128206 RepID=A0ABP0VM67_9BRYO|nr:hypothetical protein BDL97_01G105100 [Sphagnum fallax]
MGCEFPHSTKFTFPAPSLHVVNFHILVFHISWIFFTCCEFHISWIFFTCCPIASSEVLCLLQTRIGKQIAQDTASSFLHHPDYWEADC